MTELTDPFGLLLLPRHSRLNAGLLTALDLGSKNVEPQGDCALRLLERL